MDVIEVTVYICPICKEEYREKLEAQRCLARGEPDLTQRPIGMIFGGGEGMYSHIVFAIAGRNVQGHYDNEVHWACRDGASYRDSLGAERCGGSELSLSVPDTKMPAFERMSRWMVDESGVDVTVWDGSRPVPILEFLAGTSLSVATKEDKMSKLGEYVMAHTERGACRCGHCCDAPENPEEHQPNGHTVDLFFFEVSKRGGPDPDQMRELVQEHEGVHNEVDLFDGGEHGYMELGGWIGDQGLAMQMMGLGALLGLWKVFQPRLLGIPDDLAQTMAGQGMVVILPVN